MQLDEVAAVAALGGEPQHVSAAGVTRTGTRLATIENVSPFGAGASRRRLVLAADNDRAARACLGAIRWFKTDAPRQLRDRWDVSAVLLTVANDAAAARRLAFPPADGFFNHPDQPESRYVWRWATYQAPDVARRYEAATCCRAATSRRFARCRDGRRIGDGHRPFDVRDGTGDRRPGIFQVRAQRRDGQRVGSACDAPFASWTRPARHRARARRQISADSGRQLHSVGLVGEHLAVVGCDQSDALRQKVLEQTRPWVSRERPLFAARPALTAIAGTLIYADLALRGEAAAEPLAVQGADEALKVAATGYAEYGQGWTDDMFMLASILSRSGRMRGRAGDFDHLARMLVAYAERLQRSDGVFVHFTDGRIPWGRGNGFAALGLTEALTTLPQGRRAILRVRPCCRFIAAT